VKIVWPAQRLEMRLRFNDLDIVEPMNREETFTPKNLTPPRFSLAAGRLDKKKDEPKSLPSDSPIQIDLTNAHIEMRCREEMLKISGQPNSTLFLQVLKDQLHTWIAVDGKPPPSLRITCGASVEHARLKAVLDACRQAGIRKIELQTDGKTK
jgi:hypothetical protein